MNTQEKVEKLSQNYLERVTTLNIYEMNAMDHITKIIVSTNLLCLSGWVVLVQIKKNIETFDPIFLSCKNLILVLLGVLIIHFLRLVGFRLVNMYLYEEHKVVLNQYISFSKPNNIILKYFFNLANLSQIITWVK